MNVLLAKYGQISFRDEDQQTPLHLAASSGIVENVAALVQLSAGLNERDDQGRAPLHKAVANGHRWLNDWDDWDNPLSHGDSWFFPLSF